MNASKTTLVGAWTGAGMDGGVLSLFHATEEGGNDLLLLHWFAPIPVAAEVHLLATGDRSRIRAKVKEWRDGRGNTHRLAGGKALEDFRISVAACSTRTPADFTPLSREAIRLSGMVLDVVLAKCAGEFIVRCESARGVVNALVHPTKERAENDFLRRLDEGTDRRRLSPMLASHAIHSRAVEVKPTKRSPVAFL